MKNKMTAYCINGSCDSDSNCTSIANMTRCPHQLKIHSIGRSRSFRTTTFGTTERPRIKRTKLALVEKPIVIGNEIGYSTGSSEPTSNCVTGGSRAHSHVALQVNRPPPVAPVSGQLSDAPPAHASGQARFNRTPSHYGA